jgi:hypothetical protein
MQKANGMPDIMIIKYFHQEFSCIRDRSFSKLPPSAADRSRCGHDATVMIFWPHYQILLISRTDCRAVNSFCVLSQLLSSKSGIWFFDSQEIINNGNKVASCVGEVILANKQFWFLLPVISTTVDDIVQHWSSNRCQTWHANCEFLFAVLCLVRAHRMNWTHEHMRSSHSIHTTLIWSFQDVEMIVWMLVVYHRLGDTYYLHISLGRFAGKAVVVWTKHQELMG